MEKLTEKQFSDWSDRIKRSEKKAFDELFRSFYPVLVRFAMRYMIDKTISKDVVQDCFVSLWQTRKRLDATLSLKSYLYMMVRNRALNAIRDRSDVEIDHEKAKERQSEYFKNNDIESLEDVPAVGKLLKHWIDQLPDRQKEALNLSRFEGLDHDEIAVVMDVSPKTVNNHIVAALRSLRTKHEQYENRTNS